MPRTVSLHKKDIIINKKKLKEVMDMRGVNYTELHEKVVEKFGLDLEYKGFMSLMSNRSSWKLLYAHAITDTLNVSTNDIFDIVDVDIKKKAEEKKEWKKRYQK
jgi:hypothetical protein